MLLLRLPGATNVANILWQCLEVHQFFVPEMIGRRVEVMASFRVWKAVFDGNGEPLFDSKGNVVERMGRMKGRVWVERFGATGLYRFGLTGFEYKDGEPVGQETTGYIELPIMKGADTPWRMIHFHDEELGCGTIIMQFPQTNTDVRRIQICMPLDTPEENLQAIVMQQALETCEAERARAISDGSTSTA